MEKRPKRVIKNGKKYWKLGGGVYMLDTSNGIWNKPTHVELLVEEGVYTITKQEDGKETKTGEV